jgi:23S rRNA (uracil1939-C5)-methyltransferase
VIATIIDLSHDGQGVADVEGRRVFVPGALPGEEIELAVDRRRRRKRDAELVRILRAAPTRVNPGCEFFGRCGGCALQHMSYEAQIAFKQSVVSQAFGRIAGLQPQRWLAPITATQWAYRRRARLGVRLVEAKGRVLVGFRERASNYITDMSHCPVLAPPVGGALGALAETIAESTVAQRVPQVEAALGDDGGALVFRVLGELPETDAQRFDAFTRGLGLSAYVQTGGPGSVRILGEIPPRPLTYGLPAFDLQIEFAPTDFVQVNAEINARMVAEAVLQAELDGSERVLDLFCGIGNFSLPFARRAGAVLGVESDAGLVARAAHNARSNGIANAKFVTADLSKSDWPFLRETWDVVVLDPPRSGAAAIAPSFAAMSPRRIVYVSCHPATLARDAKVLSEKLQYHLIAARILDMFPNTHHVEVMAVFDRAQ